MISLLVNNVSILNNCGPPFNLRNNFMDSDKEAALALIVKAAAVIDEIFYLQVVFTIYV